MKIVKESKEKVCCFYVSDYHFEMISLPFIQNNLDENKEIIILTENNLEETIENLIEKINLKEEKKNKIIKINWKNDDKNKLEKIKENNENNLIVFIKGNKKYIKKTNEKIKNIIDERKKIKIIDCYDMEEISKEIDDIMDRYKKVLSTAGEKEIEKI